MFIGQSLLIIMAVGSFATIYATVLDVEVPDETFCTIVGTRDTFNNLVFEHKRGETLNNVTVRINNDVYTFDDWSIGDVVTIPHLESADIYITTNDKTVFWAKMESDYIPPPILNVNWNSKIKTVIIDPIAPYYFNDIITLTAIPKDTCVFDRWEMSFEPYVNYTNPFIFTITDDVNISAKGDFAPPTPLPFYLSNDEVLISQLLVSPSNETVLNAVKTNDGDTTYLYTPNHYDYYLTLFGFKDVIISESITSVNVNLVMRNKVSYSDARWILRLKINSDVFDYGHYFGLTTTYKDFDLNFAVNPQTGLSWTNEDINNLQVGILLNSAFYLNEIRLTKLSVGVI